MMVSCAIKYSATFINGAIEARGACCLHSLLISRNTATWNQLEISGKRNATNTNTHTHPEKIVILNDYLNENWILWVVHPCSIFLIVENDSNTVLSLPGNRKLFSYLSLIIHLYSLKLILEISLSLIECWIFWRVIFFSFLKGLLYIAWSLPVAISSRTVFELKYRFFSIPP